MEMISVVSEGVGVGHGWKRGKRGRKGREMGGEWIERERGFNLL